MRNSGAFAAIGGLMLCSTAAFADDWTAVQLRGQVLQLVDHQWQPLQRGMVVPDARVVRTLGSAHVTFTRGRESLDLGPDTQIQIHDRGTAERPNTVVKQYFGTVAVDAQVENVQHFAVQTSFLAAVVKGTHFTVKADKSGAAVSVQRGHVAVEDPHNHSHVTITVGQSATVDVATHETIAVSGAGTLPAVLGPGAAPGDAIATYESLEAAAKAAEAEARLLKTPEAKAEAAAAKKAADAAKKAADQEITAEKKASDDAKKAADQAAKADDQTGDGGAGPPDKPAPPPPKPTPPPPPPKSPPPPPPPKPPK